MATVRPKGSPQSAPISCSSAPPALGNTLLSISSTAGKFPSPPWLRSPVSRRDKRQEGTHGTASGPETPPSTPRRAQAVCACSQSATHREEVVVDGRDSEAVAHPDEACAGHCALLRQADSLRRLLHVVDVRNADAPLEGRRPEELGGGAEAEAEAGSLLARATGCVCAGNTRPRIRTMVFGPAGWFDSSTSRERAPVAAMWFSTHRSGTGPVSATSSRRLSAASELRRGGWHYGRALTQCCGQRRDPRCVGHGRAETERRVAQVFIHA